MPILAATAATMRVWLDCTPPIETSVSALEAIASGMMYSSLRSLLPPIGEARIAVLALGVELDLAAEMLRQPLQLLDMGGPEGERIAFEFLQACRHPR